MDNIRKDALLKDVPELVAFTSPTMGSELDKLKESVLSIGIRRYRHSARHPPGLAQSPLRGRAPSAQAGEQHGP